MMRRFLELTRESRRIRRRVEEELSLAGKEFARAAASMSGAVVRSPARKATARAESTSRERNRLLVLRISRTASVRRRFFT